MHTHMVDVFKFEFAREFPIGNPMVTLYSYTREYMDMFLTQHTFDMDNILVEHVTIESCSLNPMNLLSIYKFGSNNSDDIFNIVTSRLIIEEAVLNVAFDLTKHLYMGESIKNKNIEIFNQIASLINELPHAFILDNPDDYEPILFHDMDYLDSYENNPYNKKIYGSLFSNKNGIMNITVEGYVQSFIDMMMCRYTYVEKG